jgi:hypothetical protein
VHDVKLLEPTLDAIVMPRPEPTAEHPQHFCADAGYKGQTALETVAVRDYQPHIKRIHPGKAILSVGFGR